MFGRTTLSATSLHNCPARVNGTNMERATFLPVFDTAGRVDFVVFLDPSSSEIQIFEPPGTRVRIASRGVVSIETKGSLHVFGGDHAARAGALWHFDPWWLMKEERYQGFPHKAAVMASNCVGKSKKTIDELYYRRDLNSVFRAATTVRGTRRTIRFKSLQLPDRGLK